MIDAGSSLTDVSFAVCTAFDARGMQAVLTGGSAASFYAPNRYTSNDADFVVTVSGGLRVDDVMPALGYSREGRIFAHPSSAYTVEFPSGPLAIGGEIIRSWHTERRKKQILHVLHRTDSVRDRLCGYYFWNERQSLRLAVTVAKSGPVDFDLIRRWSRREGNGEKFAEFIRALERSG